MWHQSHGLGNRSQGSLVPKGTDLCGLTHTKSISTAVPRAHPAAGCTPGTATPLSPCSHLPSTAVPLQGQRKPSRDRGGAHVGLTALTARQRCLRSQAVIQDAIARGYSQVFSAREGTDVFRALGMLFWSTPCQRIIEKSNEGTLSSPNGDLGCSGALSPWKVSCRGLWSFMPHISLSYSG